LLSHDEHLKAGQVLTDLRSYVADSEFGYRIQALLAHVFVRLGGQVHRISSQGHPDIELVLSGRTLLIQVKAVSGRQRKFSIDPSDIQGIKPSDSRSLGYLALLDCSTPIRWMLIEHSLLVRQSQSSTSLVTLRAMANKRISEDCTTEFVNIVLLHQDALCNMSFHLLCDRAYRGDQL